jgi:hypothetical protein
VSDPVTVTILTVCVGLLLLVLFGTGRRGRWQTRR